MEVKEVVVVGEVWNCPLEEGYVEEDRLRLRPLC